MPVMDPTRKRAIVSCRRSYGTLSPIHAIDSGTIAAPVAPASTRAASSQCERQRRRAGDAADRACERGERDDAELAVVIAERPVDELHRAVGDREDRDRARRPSGRRREGLRELRQHRVADAKGRRAGERRQRQRDERDPLAPRVVVGQRRPTARAASARPSARGGRRTNRASARYLSASPTPRGRSPQAVARTTRRSGNAACQFRWAVPRD